MINSFNLKAKIWKQNAYNGKFVIGKTSFFNYYLTITLNDVIKYKQQFFSEFSKLEFNEGMANQALGREWIQKRQTCVYFDTFPNCYLKIWKFKKCNKYIKNLKNLIK